MAKLKALVIHPGSGNSPNQRRVYAKLDTGELRRLPQMQEKIALLRYDVEQQEKERKRMKRISIAKSAAIFIAIVGLVFVLALTFALAA